MLIFIPEDIFTGITFKICLEVIELDIENKIDDSVKKYLAKEGYNPDFGARPLKRVIQNEILDELALMIIEGKAKEGQTVKITIEKGKIVIK